MSAAAVESSARLACGTRARTRREPLPKLNAPIEIEIPNALRSFSSTTIRRPSWRTSVSSRSFSSPSTLTNVSSPSTVSTSTSPLGTFTSSSTGSGVWKRCSGMSLLSAPAVAGQTTARASARAAGWARLDLALERLDEPGVDREAGLGGGCVEPLLQAPGKAERDPRREGLVRRLGDGLGLVADEHELRVAACDPNLDPPVVELGVELERALSERLEEAPAERGLERDREELGRAGGRLVADRRDPRQVFLHCVHVAVDLHDGSVTSQ